mmetsp:Transcript_26230/g.67772  ORF Transcript_26230/g.67772 Transcript_26230/m.67772 type:complete len:205 (+) Transcript_26230:113-727(+)
MLWHVLRQLRMQRVHDGVQRLCSGRAGRVPATSRSGRGARAGAALRVRASDGIVGRRAARGHVRGLHRVHRQRGGVPRRGHTSCILPWLGGAVRVSGRRGRVGAPRLLGNQAVRALNRDGRLPLGAQRRLRRVCIRLARCVGAVCALPGAAAHRLCVHVERQVGWARRGGRRFQLARGDPRHLRRPVRRKLHRHRHDVLVVHWR